MIPIDFTNSTVLVTGCGGNLGATIARRYLEAGATVVAHRRRRSIDPALPRSPRLHLVAGELDDAGCEVIFSADAPYGPVDVLVNNAGSYPSQPLLDTDAAAFDRVVTDNLTTAFTALRHAARSMSAHRGGSIINIGSLSASRPGPHQVGYASAKAAVAALTRSAAVELAQHGVRVNTVSPGLVDRPGLRAAWPAGVQQWLEHCPAGRLGTAEDVANACLFLASPLASWITGADLALDGGISAAPAY